MPITNRAHKGLLDSLFGKTSVFGALASVPTVYVGLSSTTPVMAGTNFTEPSGATADQYARVATASGDWVTATDADPSVLANGAAITFPALTDTGEDWGTVTHFGLFDAATAGNLLAYGLLSPAKNPTEGDTPAFAAGDLEIRLQSPA